MSIKHYSLSVEVFSDELHSGNGFENAIVVEASSRDEAKQKIMKRLDMLVNDLLYPSDDGGVELDGAGYYTES